MVEQSGWVIEMPARACLGNVSPTSAEKGLVKAACELSWVDGFFTACTVILGVPLESGTKWHLSSSCFSWVALCGRWGGAS